MTSFPLTQEAKSHFQDHRMKRELMNYGLYFWRRHGRKDLGLIILSMLALQKKF